MRKFNSYRTRVVLPTKPVDLPKPVDLRDMEVVLTPDQLPDGTKICFHVFLVRNVQSAPAPKEVAVEPLSNQDSVPSTLAEPELEF